MPVDAPSEPGILVTDSLSNSDVPPDPFKNHFVHLLCLGGEGGFHWNGQGYRFGKNDIVIWLPEARIQDLSFSADMKAVFLLVSYDLMSRNNPDIGWGIKGYMFSQEHPVVPLEPADVERCRRNIHLLQERYNDTRHRFRMGVVNLQLQLFVMDMWQLFAERMEQRAGSQEQGSVFERFLQLVRIHCLDHREVEYYSEKLFITPKYLTEICRKNSGKPASEWIQKFTTQHMILMLKNPELSFTQITDAMNFSSQAAFSRYVRKTLGVSPRMYREQFRGA